MHKDNPFNAKVNFIISVIFIGSTALLGIVSMLEAAENPNPLTEVFFSTLVEGEIDY